MNIQALLNKLQAKKWSKHPKSDYAALIDIQGVSDAAFNMWLWAEDLPDPKMQVPKALAQVKLAQLTFLGQNTHKGEEIAIQAMRLTYREFCKYIQGSKMAYIFSPKVSA